MSCEKGECRIPQAGIFLLSDVMGVLVSTQKLVEEKLKVFLEQKFPGSEFRLYSEKIVWAGAGAGKVRSEAYVFMYFFEVDIK